MRSRLLLALLAVAAAGCGGSSDGDLASKPPQEILVETAEALDRVTSYHIEGFSVDEEGRTRLAGDFATTGHMRVAMAIGKKRVRIIVADSDTFLKANDAYWRAYRGSRSRNRLTALFTGRWVKLTPAVAGPITDVFESLLPQGLAYCMRQEPATNLTTKRPRRFAGQRVVVVADKADQPGESPDELWIAATGPALPLRVIQTGPPRPGKKRVSDPLCDSESDSSPSQASEYRISGFDKPLRINPPGDVVDLAKLAGA